MVQCKGCSRDFTSSGYKQHVIRSANSVCRAIHLKDVGTFCANGAEGTQVNDMEEDVAFEQLLDRVVDESSLDSDSSDSDGFDDLDELLAELDFTEHDTEAHEIEHFPGMKAGAPIATPTTHKPTYTKYQEKLNGDSVYAPFASKLDWEVARWAKLRGPSSSSLDELFQIEGVGDLP